jgi:hypothetical protein
MTTSFLAKLIARQKDANARAFYLKYVNISLFSDNQPCVHVLLGRPEPVGRIAGGREWP